MPATRTQNVKNLDEGFLHIIRATSNSIVAARSVGQRITATAATTLVSKTSALRGAGYAPGSVLAYAVALTAVNDATVLTIGAETATFAQGDPPGTAIPFTGAVDIAAAATIASGVSGDKFAIVEVPTYTASDYVEYITSKNAELLELKRDIRDRGYLQHRKKMAQEGGALNLTALFQNDKTGLSKFADQNIIAIFERDDDRCGVVTEKEFYFGGRINIIPGANETAGDTDSDVSVVMQFEMMAIVGES